MRYVFGKLTDKTKQYWPMTIIGYVMDVLAVPPSLSSESTAGSGPVCCS